MADPAPPPDEAFQLLQVVDGVTVRVARRATGPMWGQAEAVVEGSPASVLAHLTDFASLPRLVPRLDQLRVLTRTAPTATEAGTVIPGEAVVYFHFDLPWPISDREYTVRYRWAARDDGSIDVTIGDANALGPPARGVRITGASGAFRLVPEADGTRLRYSFTADFGGMLPRSVKEETVWRQPHETVRGIRAEMKGGASSVRR